MRIATPVNWIAPSKSVPKSAINCGKIGALAKGPKPCANETIETQARAENFQNVLQFYERDSQTLDGIPILALHARWFNFLTGLRTHKGIMRVIRGLGDQHTVRGVRGLDKVMRAHIKHYLGAGQDLDIELLLQLVELL